MAPLTAYVSRLRAQFPNAAIPDFDPWDGGTGAQALFLLEAPGPNAIRSGFVSRNNPDETAKNLFELSAQAGLRRDSAVVWNAVPWYVGCGGRIRPVTRRELNDTLPKLDELLSLLRNLRAVVFLGQKSLRLASTLRARRSDLHYFSCPHPSPMYCNRAPGNRTRVLDALRDVAAFLGPQAVGSR